MNLRQLQCFIAVAEEGGFRQGAARLRVAQPALSRQIQSIESELGFQLLDRNSRKVALTAAGDAFLRGALAVMDDLARCVRRAHLASEGRLGRCVIAAPLPALSTGAISRAAERITAEYPEIELTIAEADAPEHWEMLRDGRADLVIGLRPLSEMDGIEAESLWTDSLCCALLPAGHPLAHRASVRLDELRGDHFLALGPMVNAGVWPPMEEALRRAGITRERIRSIGTVSGARTLVAAGKGWSLVSGTYLEHPPTGTAVVRVEDFSLEVTRAALWRAGDERGVLKLVRDVLRSVCVGGGPVPARPASEHGDALDGVVPRSLELRHLEYLTAAVEAASIGAAAEELGIAQPVLSRQLRDLEQAVGVELLERGRRGVRATPAGEVLVRDTRRVMDGLEDARQSAHRAHRAAQGQCVLATITTPMSTHVVTNVLGHCAKAVPGMELEIVEVPSINQTTALLSATVDVGFGAVSLGSDTDPSIEREHMLDDPIDCVLISRDHPLAARDRVRLSDLASLPFLFAPRDWHPAFHDQVMQRLERLDFASPVDTTFQSLQLRWSRAAEGKGWCLGFHSQRKLTPRGTVAVGVDGLFVPWGMELLWRRGDEREMVTKLIEAFRRSAAIQRREA